jgi:hypothetical protein
MHYCGGDEVYVQASAILASRSAGSPLTSNHSTLHASMADGPASLDRGQRLGHIVAEVDSMIARAEILGDRSQAESLRVLLRHFKSELAQLERSGGSNRVDQGASGNQPAVEQTSAVPDEEGST